MPREEPTPQPVPLRRASEDATTLGPSIQRPRRESNRDLPRSADGGRGASAMDASKPAAGGEGPESAGTKSRVEPAANPAPTDRTPGAPAPKDDCRRAFRPGWAATGATEDRAGPQASATARDGAFGESHHRARTPGQNHAEKRHPSWGTKKRQKPLPPIWLCAPVRRNPSVPGERGIFSGTRPRAGASRGEGGEKRARTPAAPGRRSSSRRRRGTWGITDSVYRPLADR